MDEDNEYRGGSHKHVCNGRSQCGYCGERMTCPSDCYYCGPEQRSETAMAHNDLTDAMRELVRKYSADLLIDALAVVMRERAEANYQHAIDNLDITYWKLETVDRQRKCASALDRAVAELRDEV